MLWPISIRTYENAKNYGNKYICQNIKLKYYEHKTKNSHESNKDAWDLDKFRDHLFETFFGLLEKIS